MTTTGSGSARQPPSGWIRGALNDAFAELNAGRPEAAATLCRRVLSAAPALTEAHFLVGLTALAMDDPRTAVSAFGSVTRLRPEHGAAWAQLARLFMQAGQANRADRALAEATAHAGDDPVVHDLIGITCTLMGEQEAARSWYARAVAGAPEQHGYRVNLANALVFLGRTDEARAELERVLAARPDNAQAHWLLAGVRKADDRSHVETMVRLIARGRHGPRGLAFLYYALGKELEDLEEWPRAFEAFARGAAERRKTLRFDEAREQASYDTLARVFTSGRRGDGRAGAGEAFAGDPVPVFVVGQPRTGTTLVERIITAHSQVSSAGELQQFGLSLRRLLDYRGSARFSPELFEQAAQVDASALGRAYLTASAPMRGEQPCFVDVRYEDVVADTERETRRLLQYLDLPWEEGCLEFHRQPYAVATASAVQVREPAHTRSVGRWRRYETELAPMREVLDEGGIATG